MGNEKVAYLPNYSQMKLDMQWFVCSV